MRLDMDEILRLEALIKEIDEAISNILTNGVKFNTGATTGMGAGVTMSTLPELRKARQEAADRLEFLQNIGVW